MLLFFSVGVIAGVGYGIAAVMRANGSHTTWFARNFGSYFAMLLLKIIEYCMSVTGVA